MELFIVDAFTNQIFGGNQAGVVLLDEDENFPKASIMQKIASELKHSETAFVKTTGHMFEIRYFTPKEEIELCGHATISTFTVLREEKKLEIGDYIANTMAGNLKVTVEPDLIWLEMPQGKLLKKFSPEESIEIYQAFGLPIEDRPQAMQPCIVNTGLSDILLPVNSIQNLNQAIQNREEVIRISKRHNVVGVHMFYYESSPKVTVHCRNFAPLYEIDEEAATGTSNGALTYYLYTMGLISERDENIFVQGTSMGKPSIIRSRVNQDKLICIGGNAVVSISGRIRL